MSEEKDPTRSGAREDREAPGSARDPRRPYVPPRIRRVDRLDEVILGGSPGVGDSGATGTELPPP